VHARKLLRPYALLYLYGRRLRVHTAQELLAAAGVAIGVALVFAVTVTNSGIAGSAGEAAHAVIGPANLQLHARSSEGFDEHLLARVEHLAGVEQAAPLLEQTATINAPGGRRATVDLAGTNAGLTLLDGLAHTLPIAALSPGGIGLSRTSARELGIHAAGQRVAVGLRGVRSTLRVSAVLGPEAFGVLARDPVAVMPLADLQRLSGLPGRISRILIQTSPGRTRTVRAELQELTGGQITIAPANQDVALLRQALGPSNQASRLFAVISALLGFLFAFNAMLLTVPERRQAIADLRIDGTRRSAIVQMVLFQALCLGVAASLAGLLAGYALATGVLHQSPGYLARAFTLGRSTAIGFTPLLLSLGGGVLASCLASTLPLLDLRHGRPLDAVHTEDGIPGNGLASGKQNRLFLVAVCLIVLASIVFAFVPSAAIVVCLLLAPATVLAVPLSLSAALRTAERLVERHQTLTTLPVAITSLRATSLRSLALAATGAVALFGSVALAGSRDDLLRGIAGYTSDYVSAADIWIVNPGDNQAIDEFSPGGLAAGIARLPGVASVHAFQGSYLDVGTRRLWVIAWPPELDPTLLNRQLISGNRPAASARLREGGWIVVSEQFARERHAGVGDTLSIPTPSGERPFRLAATTTNFGWSPGAILMSTADYSRSWGTRAPSALGVDLRASADPASVQSAIAASLGADSALEVLSARARAARIGASASEGLGQLGQISTLLVIAAVLAMLAALGSNIWQRRIALAGLRLDGAAPARLRRILLAEALVILGAGCLTGAVTGIYGQLVIDGYLKHVTGFPVANLTTGQRPLEIFVLVVVCVLMLAAFPGWLASRVSPLLALDE
jgi:putative ABC transport system permease protein